jgi:hypothetical protein
MGMDGERGKRARAGKSVAVVVGFGFWRPADRATAGCRCFSPLRCAAFIRRELGGSSGADGFADKGPSLALLQGSVHYFQPIICVQYEPRIWALGVTV